LFATRQGRRLLADREPLQTLRAAHRLDIDPDPLLHRRFLAGEHEFAAFCAIGMFKNPSSQRKLDLSDATFASEGGR
jgi:hypothetical protein